jgi:hypothetical protein
MDDAIAAGGRHCVIQLTAPADPVKQNPSVHRCPRKEVLMSEQDSRNLLSYPRALTDDELRQVSGGMMNATLPKAGGGGSGGSDAWPGGGGSPVGIYGSAFGD